MRHTVRVSSPSAVAPAHVHVDRPNVVSVGTIVWLASELMFFAGLFAMYFTHRSVNADQWPAGVDHLDIPFSTVNTLILVSSSFTCQMGVWAAERFQTRRTGSLLDFRKWGVVEWFTLTFIMGAVFIGGQVYEYAALYQHGLDITSSYGSVFFITTGFHGLHVLGGLIAFLFVLARTFAAKRYGHHEATSAIVVSYYWHFVDVVWIALFAMIYIIR
ncbi:MAG: heme-copper oxidase subunit III [bacterium]|nr:heme-copper oxidase subunit III [bacterium]